jgi:glycerol-3-phosphate dehydrogenase
VLPTYGWGMSGPIVMGIGLALYDLLSFDRNWLSDDDKKLPGFKRVSKGKALDMMPSLKRENLTGAMIYYDCQMHAPERLCLECIEGAAEYGADAANYAEVTGFTTEASMKRGVKVSGVNVLDKLTGETYAIRGRVVVNAAGPWADKTMALVDETPARRLIRSKGIHIITRDLSGSNALAIKSELGGHFFVIPWRGHTIIGTTDTVFEEDPDDLGVTERDIENFLIVVNDGLPGLNLTRKDVLHFYAGLRPLVDTTPQEVEGSPLPKDSYNASRAAEVFDHGTEEAIDGLISAIGGKWTTSRHLAEQVVDLALKKLGQTAPCETHCTPVYGGEIGRLKSYIERAQKKYPHLAPEIVANLVDFYGSRIDEVLATADERQGAQEGEREELLRRLSPQTNVIGAQVVHAVRHEMALHLEDVVFRRTGLGTLGHPGVPAIAQAAELMRRELGWDETQHAREIAETVRQFDTV